MRRRGRRQRGDLRVEPGQALTEYALIMATVVAAFAGASYIGVPQSIVARLNQTHDAYNVQLPDKFTPQDIGQRAQQFNDQIPLK